MRERSGVSVVICCHNSANRIVPTLEHLGRQEVHPKVAWEVLLVDNASTDDTVARASSAWARISNISLNIVKEPRLGLCWARQSGISHARFEYISLVDDDNWVNADWIQNVFDSMEHHPSVGVCGGDAVAVFEGTAPIWFETHQHSYAVGRQADAPGDITHARGYVWGAGLCLRKSAWEELTAKGYRPLLSDRLGKRMSCGGDTEMCYALQLTGWKIWYEPALKLKHFMPASRLTWPHLRAIMRGYGRATVALDPYVFAIRDKSETVKRSCRKSLWLDQAHETLRRLRRRRRSWRHWLVNASEGDPGVLDIDKDLWRLMTLLRLRGGYDRNVQAVAVAGWRVRQTHQSEGRKRVNSDV